MQEQYTPNRNEHIDLLRGVLAILVLLGHIRGFVLVDYSAVTNTNFITAFLYFMFSLGHEAVIGFFALSGFLVGGQLLRDIRGGLWSAERYAINRLSRLWTVVLPALFFTLIFDNIAYLASNTTGYTGSYWYFLSSGPSPNEPAQQSIFIFVANLLFLQTIVAPVFGSNGPLWSLAYEFWYYVLFPLFMLAFLSNWKFRSRMFVFVLACGILILLPIHLSILGIVWLAGALSYFTLLSRHFSRFFAQPYFLLSTSAALLLGILLARTSTLLGDVLLGLLWAIFLPAIYSASTLGHTYRACAKSLSEISFSLYATHFPLLAAIYFTAIAPAQFQPTPYAMLLITMLLLLSVSLAAFSWWAFERNTLFVRMQLMLMINYGRALIKQKF